MKRTCKTCRYNQDSHCNVGTHYAEQGKDGVCYEGELWEAKTDPESVENRKWELIIFILVVAFILASLYLIPTF